jgi:NitT/TauT family transport system substrate-binding protein
MKALFGAMIALLCGLSTAQAEVDQIRVTYQPGIIYLPVVVMQQAHLIEKQGAAHGVPGLTASFSVFGGGGAATDALLSGNVDLVTTGVSNLLLLWDRTKGQVKGYANAAATPLWLISRNPKVVSLKDLTDADRIAVPTVKISSQAILLQIAARKIYGDAGYDHFDGMEVTMGHPDASTALATGSLTGHFSGPPFQQAEAELPGMHVVTTSTEIMGGPLSNAIYFGTQKFHDANPHVVAAFLAAAQEADDIIAHQPQQAVAMYVAQTGEKMPVDALVKIVQSPGMYYDMKPVGTFATALHMADTKVLKTRPSSWKDYMFPEGFGLDGN